MFLESCISLSALRNWWFFIYVSHPWILVRAIKLGNIRKEYMGTSTSITVEISRTGNSFSRVNVFLAKLKLKIPHGFGGHGVMQVGFGPITMRTSKVIGFYC